MNIFQFNEGTCEVLQLGYDKHIQQPGADWVKSSFAEKVLGIPVNNKDGLEYATALIAMQANHILGCVSTSTDSRSREVITTPGSIWRL